MDGTGGQTVPNKQSQHDVIDDGGGDGDVTYLDLYHDHSRYH